MEIKVWWGVFAMGGCRWVGLLGLISVVWTWPNGSGVVIVVGFVVDQG